MKDIVITTQRTQLKFPLPYVNAEQVVQAIADPDTVRYMSAVPNMEYTVEDAESFLNFLRYTETSVSDLELGVFLRATNTFVGMCALESIDIAQGTCELGYWLSKACVGSGLMFECASALIQCAQNQLHMKVINAYVITAHERSIRLLERLGFTRKDRLVNDVENKGELVDRYWYQLRL